MRETSSILLLLVFAASGPHVLVVPTRRKMSSQPRNLFDEVRHTTLAESLPDCSVDEQRLFSVQFARFRNFFDFAQILGILESDKLQVL